MDMELNGTNDDGLGIEVVLPEGDTKAPCCPHGPTLLFEKASKSGEKGRRFYACSACRDRKDCNFFQWEDEKVSEARLLARESENKSKKPLFTHKQYCSRFKVFKALREDQRRLCGECDLLLVPEERSAHIGHKAPADDITDGQLQRPSTLLPPLENKKSNAQYLFTDRSSHFLLDTLAGQGFRKVLCVGTPRLHELIKLRNLDGKNKPMKSLLLDIDFRYAQFYGQDEFCHYNMFNHHFFGGEAAQAMLQAFLSEGVDGEQERVVMVADPPFGGLVKPLANSFSSISKTWQSLQPSGGSDKDMPMIWIFPYFFEPRILECFPSFVMLDYQVDYDNHPLYKHGKTGRKQSPVRLFTNLAPRDIVLPKEEGYRYCAMCQRYVCSQNRHCSKCNVCPSKDGREWRHCSECQKCFKPSWRHCASCGRCTLPDHPCGQGQGEKKEGCFNCGSLAHKRRACPRTDAQRSHNNKTKVKKGSKNERLPKPKRKTGAARRAMKKSAPVT